MAKSKQQEEVHLEKLTAILNTYNVLLIPPCNYSFPVSSAKEFFEVADLIGSVGISATIGLSQRLALPDPCVARLISSILSVESRHDAFFRDVKEREPNLSPFDTGISASRHTTSLFPSSFWGHVQVRSHSQFFQNLQWLREQWTHRQSFHLQMVRIAPVVQAETY